MKEFIWIGVVLPVFLAGVILGVQLNTEDPPIVCESGTEVPSNFEYEVSRTICNVGNVNGKPVTVIVID